jgi:hypothetical protein
VHSGVRHTALYCAFSCLVFTPIKTQAKRSPHSTVPVLYDRILRSFILTVDTASTPIIYADTVFFSPIESKIRSTSATTSRSMMQLKASYRLCMRTAPLVSTYLHEYSRVEYKGTRVIYTQIQKSHELKSCIAPRQYCRFDVHGLRA